MKKTTALDDTRAKGTAAGQTFRVLSLDGGGTKGFQTLGVLQGIETAAGRPLGECFDLIWGTSVGACTAGLLATGASVKDIIDIYRREIPALVAHQTPKHRSARLHDICRELFGDRMLSTLRPPVGVVCTDWNRNETALLRTYAKSPSINLTLSNAVAASCSAYPLFEPCYLDVNGGGEVELVDGGYGANNPTLYAIAESIRHFGKAKSNLRVVSVGGGIYPSAQPSGFRRLLKLAQGLGILEKTMLINTATTEQAVPLIFPDVSVIRFNDHFDRGGLSETIVEMSPAKHETLVECGTDSFASRESQMRTLLGWPPS